MDTSDLAKRMKDYEAISKTRLMKRCPVICRIDGKAHHTFTRGFERPFDYVYMKSMQETAQYLCENLQGVVLSYQQSDEITLVFVDYEKLNTAPYFDYEVQKLCSVIASMATLAFNRYFRWNVECYGRDCHSYYKMHGEYAGDMEQLLKAYRQAIEKGAMFDARVFNIPKEEVTNCIYWRQLDAIRNSIQMVGHANFTHKELHGKNCNDIQDMLMLQKGIDWNHFLTAEKRGTCVIRAGKLYGEVEDKREWVLDVGIPIFKGEGREYIERLVRIDEE